MTAEGTAYILSLVSYKDWRFHLDAEGEQWWLQVRWEGRDSFTGEQVEQHGRKWLLSPHMVKSEVVQTALMAVLAVEEHEAREGFKYRGQRIFGPHLDVEAVVRMVAGGEGLDYRGRK